MKKIILNVLVVSCLMSSVSVKAISEDEAEAAIALGSGGLTLGVVAMAGGTKAMLAKHRWGSLAIGVPAVAFKVPFTPENKAILEAAKNKNNAFLRKKLIELNKNLGIRALHPMFLLEREISKLWKKINKIDHYSTGEPLERRLHMRLRLVRRRNILKLKVKKLELKYKAQFQNWETLGRLYAAIDAIYYGKGQYKRFFGLYRSFELKDDGIAIKEKLDKQLGIYQ